MRKMTEEEVQEDLRVHELATRLAVAMFAAHDSEQFDKDGWYRRGESMGFAAYHAALGFESALSACSFRDWRENVDE